MSSNRRGIALILTLWILAALIVLAAGLGMTVRTETQISRNYGDLIRCRWAARAGENRGIVEIESLRKQPQTYFEDGKLLLASLEEEIEMDDASYDVVIEDEAGKVNINTAPRTLLENLFGSRDIADCIIDWRDKNDVPRPLGAESQYYAGQMTPYRSKNRAFDTVQELLLVKGVTREMLDEPVGDSGQTLADMLTVYSRDKNVTVDEKERLNIGKAGKAKIKEAIGDILNDKEIDALIKRRDRREFKTAGEIAQVPGIGRRKVRRIYDRITVSDKKKLPGRININTAPAEVLAAIQGFDSGMAEEIVEYRTSRGPFSDVGQLMEVTGVTDDAFARAADLLTVRSRVFKITSTGRLIRENSSRAIICVADATDGQTAQIRYWRE